MSVMPRYLPAPVVEYFNFVDMFFTCGYVHRACGQRCDACEMGVCADHNEDKGEGKDDVRDEGEEEDEGDGEDKSVASEAVDTRLSLTL